MNTFESLIDELKEENLLEKTFSETKKAEHSSGDEAADENSETANFFQNDESENQNRSDVAAAAGDNLSKGFEANQIAPESYPTNAAPAEAVDQNEFFRRRATDEVSGLQIVEQFFSGVERQQKKITPKPYDDLKVKKALHNFLQIPNDVKSTEYAQAEFQLMQETEDWYSHLSYRDKQISTTHLRRYCETSKPALSAPALTALARFYRNAPYSEAVRSKFDLIVTRLFSEDLKNSKRKLIFQRDELIKRLSELYGEWESLALHSASADDESKILLSAFKFEDLMSEAENAGDFDELIRNDFFNRLRSFKENTAEVFFAPLATATAIESNVRIGNKYVDLLNQEKEKGETVKLENKYGFLHDQIISDATSKTLQLVELLKNETADLMPVEELPEQPPPVEKVSVNYELKPEFAKPSSASLQNSTSRSKFAVNKWLLVLAAAVFLISGVLYLYTEYVVAPEKLSQNVKAVVLEDTPFKEFVRDARLANNTLFAIVLPAWDALDETQKKETLKKIQATGGEKGFDTVLLLDPKGKTVGTATREGIEINK